MAVTRPRIASGATIWTMVWRMTTLSMSAAPTTTSAASDSAKLRDSAEAEVAAP